MSEKLQKYRKTLTILILSPVLVLLVQMFEGQEDTFSFNMNGDAVYDVVENGIFSYYNGERKELHNSMQVFLKYNTENEKLSMSGSAAGQIDKVLQPLIKKKDFSVELDRDNPHTFCDEKISPFYPSALRRFFYFFPQRYLFEGKRWKAFFCDQQISCHYSIASIIDKSAEIDLYCNGQIDHQEITVSTKMIFHIERQIFRSIKGRFKLKNSIMDAIWDIEDTLVTLQ